MTRTFFMVLVAGTFKISVYTMGYVNIVLNSSKLGNTNLYSCEEGCVASNYCTKTGRKLRKAEKEEQMSATSKYTTPTMVAMEGVESHKEK